MSTRRLVAAACTLMVAGPASAFDLTAAYQQLINDTPGLAHYWNFEDAAGADDIFGTVADVKGGKDGTTVGSVVSQPGVIGNTGYFIGDDDDEAFNNFVTIPDSGDDPDLKLLNQSWTIEALVRADDIDAEPSWLAIFSKGDSTWRLARQRDTDGIQGGANGLGGSITNAFGTIDNNIWHYVAMTWNQATGEHTVWFDNVGVSQTRTAGSTLSDDPNDIVHIGANSDHPEREWTGWIDEVAIYDVALTEAEVMQRINLLEDNAGDVAIDFNTLPFAPDAFFTGDAPDNNQADDDNNWLDGAGPTQWVAPGSGTALGGTGVQINEGTSETDPLVYDVPGVTRADHLVIGRGTGEDDTIYVQWDEGELYGDGNSNTAIGDGASVDLVMNGGEINHTGGLEETTELVIGDGDETATVNIELNGDARIATGHYEEVVSDDPRDPFADDRILPIRRRRSGDLGPGVNPQRWGDDLKIGEGSNANVTLNDNSKIIVTDVFYMNDESGSDAVSTLTLNDQSELLVSWDTRVHDEPGTHIAVMNLNDSSRWIAGFDQAFGDAGTGWNEANRTDGDPDTRWRYEMELNINDDAQLLAGDRVWFGAGSSRYFEGEFVDGEGFQAAYNENGVRIGTNVLGKLTVNLNDNGVVKAGNDTGDFNVVDGTGLDAIVRIGDFFIQMGHGADATINIGDETADGNNPNIEDNPLMQATRHIYVGSGGRGQATVNQYAGTVKTLTVAQGSVDAPFGLAGNSADVNYRPSRGWVDRGGQIVIGYDTKGTYRAMGGVLNPGTELVVGWQGSLGGSGGGDGYLLIDGGTVQVGRDTIIGRLAQLDGGEVLARPKGEIEFVSGTWTTRDIRVGDEGIGKLTLTSSPEAGVLSNGSSSAQFTGDLSFGGNFDIAKQGSGTLGVSLKGADLPTLEGVGGAFNEGASLSNVLIWEADVEVGIDVLYNAYRPTTGDTFELITYGGSRTGTFEGITGSELDGIDWSIQYVGATDEDPISKILLVADTVYLDGDIDRNGMVDEADLSLLIDNWESQDAIWATADLTNDGTVNEADLSLLIDNWETGVLDDASLNALAAAGIVIPEPTAAALMALGSIILVKRRRRA